jgi:hypothetical protein
MALVALMIEKRLPSGLHVAVVNWKAEGRRVRASRRERGQCDHGQNKCSVDPHREFPSIGLSVHVSPVSSANTSWYIY